MQPILNIALKAARKAETSILRSLDRLDTIRVTQKGLNDFVTDIDKKVEKDIISVIHEAYPGHQIIAEESGLHEGKSDYIWIIDPIDGTHNFYRGIPHFCISIGFLEKGKVKHGLIYDVVRQELFTASRGNGARLNDKRLRVSQTMKLNNALIAMGFPVKYPEQLSRSMEIFRTILPQTANMRCSGSAALDLAYVAAGRLDGFLEEQLKPWDLAAGSLLVQEAGGLVCDWSGAENFLQTGNVVAATPKILSGLMGTLGVASPT